MTSKQAPSENKAMKWTCSHCQAINPAGAYKCHNCPNTCGDEYWYTPEETWIHLSEAEALSAAAAARARREALEEADVAISNLKLPEKSSLRRQAYASARLTIQRLLANEAGGASE